MPSSNPKLWSVAPGDPTHVFAPDLLKPINCHSAFRARRVVAALNAFRDVVRDGSAVETTQDDELRRRATRLIVAMRRDRWEGHDHGYANDLAALLNVGSPLEPTTEQHLTGGVPVGQFVASLIVSAEEAKQPLAFRHWSKDPLIPYANCHCDTCLPLNGPGEQA